MCHAIAVDAILAIWSDRHADHFKIVLFGVSCSAHRLSRRSWTISFHSLLLCRVILSVSWVTALCSLSSDDLGHVDCSRRFSDVFDGSKIRARGIHRLLGFETSGVRILILSLVQELLVLSSCLWKIKLLFLIWIRASAIHQLRARVRFSITFGQGNTS